MKKIFLMAAALTALAVLLFFASVISAAMLDVVAAVAYLFIGERYWAQTVADMRMEASDPDNLRMLTQLSMRSWSMLLPALTAILAWPLFMVFAYALAMSLDHEHGPLTSLQHQR